MTARAAALERIFAALFENDERTRLLGGASEPFYSPAAAGERWHCIHYREDFPASALHEVAHWCIAGPARRQLPDYGYWYAPDGRDAAAQRVFESVEVRPQGLEWLFAQACALPFHLSFDNPGAEVPAQARERFAMAVAEAARQWQARGPGGRAGRFVHALRRAFPAGLDVAVMRFEAASLLGR